MIIEQENIIVQLQDNIVTLSLKLDDSTNKINELQANNDSLITTIDKRRNHKNH